MKIIDERIKDISEIIDSVLGEINDSNRAEKSSQFLSHIRNFCEAFMYKIYDEEQNVDLFQTHENTKKVRTYIGTKYPEIKKFHNLLDASVGHTDFGKNQSEALVLKYIPYLVKAKDFLLREYNILTLENIKKYPLDLDDSITSFYEKILFVLLNEKNTNTKLTRNQYFVRKRSIKYLNNHIFYEYVFDVTDDKQNKFNTFVCYSLKDIKFNYDLRLVIEMHNIKFLKTDITINVVYDYEYSIRPCAFKNMLLLLDESFGDCKRDKDYQYLMKFLKDNGFSLLDLIDDNIVLSFPNPKSFYKKFISLLRRFCQNKNFGTNLIRFLLVDMKNWVIKDQLYKSYGDLPQGNELFDNLRIRTGSKSFELMPFAFFPKSSRPSLSLLFELYDADSRKEEVLYHQIVEYINDNNALFIKPVDIGYEENTFKKLAKAFNKKLLNENSYFNDYRITEIDGCFTIYSYLEQTKDIFNYVNFMKFQEPTILNNNYSTNDFLSIKQKEILSTAFLTSSIALVTGAAGTGKTTLIKEFIKQNRDIKILCLTTTNSANNNLRIDSSFENVSYKNISVFEQEQFREDFDAIIIDEAGFVSTKSAHKILSTYKNSVFLISGDPKQLESIEFGNWFKLLLCFDKFKDIVFTLDEEQRINSESVLSKLWKEVREGHKDNILEMLSVYNMTEKISEDIFNLNENEIVLCLNYDGLYGINNINRYLQASNKKEPHEYQQNVFKVNDPVVFITNDYNNYGIYNNLKGKILYIHDTEESITFGVDLYKKLDCDGDLSEELKICNIDDENSLALISKNKFYSDGYDFDMDLRTKLPFQICYAMSIHKAQGLEFDNVKIVITKESDELITKNIFYTAITRCRKNLKIYWEPEVANEVLDYISKTVDSEKNDIFVINKMLSS